MKDKKILFVDDEEIFLELISDILADSEYTLYTASDAEDALKIIASKHIDILITDITMPGLSGVELAEQAYRHSPDIKIVFMSGLSTLPEESLSRAQDLPSFKFLHKPFSISAMISLLEQIAVTG